MAFRHLLGTNTTRNKIFNFVSYEAWRTINPLSVINTLPTAEQRGGDFSKALNTAGGLRTIYDPYTTEVSGNTGWRRCRRRPDRVPQRRGTG
jgi:hypothetical protein